MFLKDLNKFNSDFVDGKHAGTSADNVLVLDASGKVPLAQVPTGTTKDTVSLGNHTHAYAGSSSVGGAATSALKCTGNSATATTLETARTINGTSFNGSANITTANWGTARTVKIGNTGKSVNGSGNYTWTLSEIGALPLTGGTMTGGVSFPNGSGNAVKLTTTGSAVVNGVYMSNENDVMLGNNTTDTVLASYDNPMVSVGSVSSATKYSIYHEGNKPTPEAIGALSVNGGTLKGHLYMNPEKVIATANNYGLAGYLTDGTNYDYLIFMDTNNKVHLGWNDRPIVIDCENPVQRSNNKLYHEGYLPTNIDSKGVMSPQTGRNQNLGNVYTYSTNTDVSGGPTVYSAVLGFGRGTAGTVEICGEWTEGHGLWARALRDWQDDWYGWQRIFTENTCPGSGNWFSGGAPKVDINGVMEIGKYIDFHETGSTTADYDSRLYSSNGVICSGGAIQARGLLSTETTSGSQQANVCFLNGSNKLIFAQNGMFLFYSNDNGTQYWNMVAGYNTYSRLGNPDYRFKECYLEANPNVSSDRVLKENINYIRNNDTSTASTFSLMSLDEEDVNTNNSTDITYTDMYNFVRDDLELATFNYIKEPIEETNADTQDTENNETIDIDTSNKDFVDIKTDRNIIDFNITDRDVRLGFIAQDLLYNEDQTDNKVGQFIVTPASVEDGRTLEYNEGDYVNVLAGALKQAINEIETLKRRIEELEGDI